MQSEGEVDEELAKRNTLRSKFEDQYENRYIKVAELTNGQAFGELALINNKPRAATITALSACHFAVVDRASFNVIKHQTVKKTNNKIDLISNIPSFKNVTRVALSKFCNYFKE